MKEQEAMYAKTAMPVNRMRKTQRSLRILVAEDTPATRKLAVRLLENRGHHVLAVQDGREAVALLEREHVDVILMDIQMPEMDGVEATRAIRKSTHSASSVRVPIVAVSAQASRTDRERCLAAGMDAFVAKPFDVRRLVELVESIAASARNDAGQPSSEHFDCEAMLERLDNNSDLFRDVAQVLWEKSPTLLARIRRAIADNNTAALAQASHAVASLASNFDAHQAVAVAQELEEMAHREDLGQAAAAAQRLDELMHRLAGSLADSCASLSAHKNAR